MQETKKDKKTVFQEKMGERESDKNEGETYKEQIKEWRQKVKNRREMQSYETRIEIRKGLGGTKLIIKN